MHKNALSAGLCLTMLIAVIALSEPSQDTAIEQATAADVHDAITTAQQVAVAQSKGIEE